MTRTASESPPILAAVLGADVSKSRSPAIHQAAFRALGIEGRYQAFSVTARGFRPLVESLRRQGYRYLNVTIPHKAAAAALTTTRSSAVRVSGAANTLIFTRGKAVRGDNTDGLGLLAALAELGADVRSGDRVRVAVMVGAGGAAAGAIAALTSAKVHVRIVARRPAAARALRRRFSPARRRLISVFPWTDSGLGTALEGAQVLVSSVPAAAWEPAAPRAGLARLAPGTAVLEMAYGGVTPLARAVDRPRLRYADGLGMLVHQAAHAVTLALGASPPIPPLKRAARRPPVPVARAEPATSNRRRRR